MAKDLPYFKFYVSEWNDGDITLEDLETQGLFINICSFYWSKNGDITLTKIKKRFRDAKPTAFDSLIEEGIIKVDENDCLLINFLDEQIKERDELSKKNSKNGAKGGRPKKPKKPTALISESELKAKKSNIEERRGEEKREEEIRRDNINNAFSEKLKKAFSDEGKKMEVHLFEYKKHIPELEKELLENFKPDELSQSYLSTRVRNVLKSVKTKVNSQKQEIKEKDSDKEFNEGEKERRKLIIKQAEKRRAKLREEVRSKINGGKND